MSVPSSLARRGECCASEPQDDKLAPFVNFDVGRRSWIATHGWLSIILTGLVLTLGIAPPRPAFAQTHCAFDQVPEYRGAFQQLASLLGWRMGRPLDCEHALNADGDTGFLTSEGQAAWRKHLGAAVFANEVQTWALLPDGLKYWYKNPDGQWEGPWRALTDAACDAMPPDATGEDAAFCFSLFAHTLILDLVRKVNTAEASAPSTPAGTPAVTAPVYPRPTRDDLVVTITSIDTLLGQQFPTINGRACNRARGWKATNVRIEFECYHDSLLPPLDFGKTSVRVVQPGFCEKFAEQLTLLQSWRTIAVKEVRWTWSPEGS
jgi:hypothetical protein